MRRLPVQSRSGPPDLSMTLPLNPKLRLALAQINPTVGDFPANRKKILEWIRRAQKNKADLIVFPEMALCGYPVWDLANHKDFVQSSEESLAYLQKLTQRLEIGIVLGLILPGNQPALKRNYNALVFMHRGKIVYSYAKQLLPTYDVFLEDIFFEPGTSNRPIEFKNWRLGFTICEDIWDSRYPKKPVQELGKKGIDLLINISASPYHKEAAIQRLHTVQRHVREHHIPAIYLNQVGAQDDLIFDGKSFILNPDGAMVHELPSFQETMSYYQISAHNFAEKISFHPNNEPAHIYEALKLGVRDYCRKNSFTKVVLGLSGGIDSALTAAIAVDALGSDAVKGITMPSIYSSPGSWQDARDLAHLLGIEFEVRPIKHNYQSFLRSRYGKKYESQKITLSMENLQARLRGLDLMFCSNEEGRLLLTTGNKSELAMGYCTLYGDMCGGLAVLGDVYKTDVYRLAYYRNEISKVIPESTLTKPPSAELRPNQKDQDSLPPYDVLDSILVCLIEKQMAADDIYQTLRHLKISKSLIKWVIQRVDHNEYKRRQTPPILRVTEKAWFGRRMPITNKFSTSKIR